MTDSPTTSRRLLGWLLVPLLAVAAIGAWFLLDPGFRTTSETAGADGSMPRDAFEQRVRAYLLENPEVLVEAMQRLEARRRAAEQLSLIHI